MNVPEMDGFENTFAPFVFNLLFCYCSLLMLLLLFLFFFLFSEKTDILIEPKHEYYGQCV